MLRSTAHAPLAYQANSKLDESTERCDKAIRARPSLSKFKPAALVAMCGIAIIQAWSATAHADSCAWCSPTLSPEKRAEMALSSLSLDEKIAIINGRGATSKGIPAFAFTDGPVGPALDGAIASIVSGISPSATALPAGITLAASFNTELARTFGEVVGVETKHRGFNGVYGPNLDVLRTPLAGRTFEGYGEDPFLVSQMGVGWINGLQSQGVMASAKHFIANTQEGQLGLPPLTGLIGGRINVNAIISDRRLHEIDLPPFEAAIKEANVNAIMCSYNQINGQYACQNPLVLQKLLRDELGFAGTIVSDAGAAYLNTAGDINAGLNIDILSTAYNSPAVKIALGRGLITTSAIDANVFQVLKTTFASGLADRALYLRDPSKDDRVKDAGVALRTAQEGAVLLKNAGGILPISSRTRSIAVIGPAASHYASGGGSSYVVPYVKVSPLEGIRARAAQASIKVTYDDASNMAEALAHAKLADMVIVVAADAASEGVDKSCMSLNASCFWNAAVDLAGSSLPALKYGDQDALIKAVSVVSPGKTVVVLETGAPVLTPWRDSVAAILEAWYPGQQGGTAIASLLFGDAEPGGRLPATFPARYSDIPTAKGGAASYPGVLTLSGGHVFQENYSEDVFVGYRWYDTQSLTPAFPFGFGLSYTTFDFSNLAINGRTVTATVSNNGGRGGWAVPQLYVGLPSSYDINQPPKQLKGFQKIWLDAGQSKVVTFMLNDRALSYWDGTRWSVASGCKGVFLGSSSRDLPLQGQLCS